MSVQSVSIFLNIFFQTEAALTLNPLGIIFSPFAAYWLDGTVSLEPGIRAVYSREPLGQNIILYMLIFRGDL